MGIDTTLAKFLAQVSEFTYHFDPVKLAFRNDPETIGSPRIDPPLVGGDKQTAVAGVMHYGHMVVLAFRGTLANVADSGFLGDWHENFKPTLVTDPDQRGLVHQGFNEQLNAIREGILASLGPAPGLPLYITGHSQGAALATLATPWLAAKGFNVVAAYTFAAPRAGDSAFAESVTTPVYRVEFGDDIVPHVPFAADPSGIAASLIDVPLLQASELQRLLRTVADGYVAVGSLTYRRWGEDLQTDLNAEAEATLASERQEWLKQAGAHALLDHFPAKYIAMFDANLDDEAMRGTTQEIIETGEDTVNTLFGRLRALLNP